MRQTMVQSFCAAPRRLPSIVETLDPSQSLPPVDAREAAPAVDEATTARRSQRPTAVGGSEDLADPLPKVGEIVGGHYRLVRKLGEGMFGRVYVAERTDVPEHRVALKAMVRAVHAGRNVERELVMLAAASHPNIVQLKDHGSENGVVWLTMPLYRGETLEERLERGPLSLREAYEIFLPVARGLQTLHERGLRHQDIKPENVFLAQINDRVHPVLLDLGVAVECNSCFVAGTVLYGSPEQISALSAMTRNATLSEKVDSYCLASTLLYALVGPDHFPGGAVESPLGMANSLDERATTPLREGALPHLSGKPRESLNAALAKWLQRDPDDRPAMAEVAAGLDVLLEQEQEAELAIQHGLAQQRQSLQRVRVTLGAVALIAAGVGAYGYSQRETWRLAGELQQARDQGAASFDKLDTCVAAHQIAQHDAASYRDQRDAASQAQTQATTELATLRRESSQREERLGGQLGRSQGKLRSCRDDAKAATTQFEQQRSELQTSLSQVQTTLDDDRRAWSQERQKLEHARDDHQSAAMACTASLDKSRQSYGQCEEKRLSCISERDAALARATKAPPAPAAKDAPPSEDKAKPAPAESKEPAPTPEEQKAPAAAGDPNG